MVTQHFYKWTKLSFFPIVFCFSAQAQQATLWTHPSWPATAVCQNLIQISTQKQDLPEDQGGTEKSFNTDTLIIWKDGKILLEFYDGTYNEKSAHALWSASKTITATLIGAAIQQGKLQLNDKISKFISLSEFGSDRNAEDINRYRTMTVSDVLYMSSGFDWKERYEAAVQESSVLNMIYGDGKYNVVNYALSSHFVSAGPGNYYTYSSGNSNILQMILKKIYGANYVNMPWRLLFNPLNIEKAVVEMDMSGTFVGSSHFHMTTRDLLKIGLLFYDRGVVRNQNGKTTRILPTNWIQVMNTIAPGMLNPNYPAPGASAEEVARVISDEDVYGGGVWLNKALRGAEKPFPNASDDLYMAAGHYGQLIVVIPSQKTVIVRFGHDSEYWSKLNEFFSGVEQCLN